MPKQSGPKYTMEAGRSIKRNGKPFAAIMAVNVSDAREVDTFARDVVEAMNALPNQGEILRSGAQGRFKVTSGLVVRFESAHDSVVVHFANSPEEAQMRCDRLNGAIADG